MNNISELKSKKKKYTNNIFGHGLGLQVEENEITFFGWQRESMFVKLRKESQRKKAVKEPIENFELTSVEIYGYESYPLGILLYSLVERLSLMCMLFAIWYYVYIVYMLF